MSSPDDRSQMSANQRCMLQFANQFDPPLRAVPFLKLNNAPVQDGWQVAIWDNGRGIGVTAMVFGNQLMHAFVEASGETDEKDAASVGAIMAQCVGLAPKGKGDGKA